MAPSTRLNAAVGTVVAAVLFSVPGGPLLGGAVAGYLEGEGRTRAATVGALVAIGTSMLVAAWYLLATSILLDGFDHRLVGSVGDLLPGVSLLLVGYLLVSCVAGGLLGGLVAERGR